MAPKSTNYLANDVEITGSVIFEHELHCEAKIDGTIHSPGLLIVAREGVIRGDIHAGAVSIFGHVRGNITVLERCELHATARLEGDLKAPRLIIEEGATFLGNSQVIPQGQALPQPQKERENLPAPPQRKAF